MENPIQSTSELTSRKERTLAGYVIGTVHDLFSKPENEGERESRAASNDYIATIAADTAAVLFKRCAAGSLVRASMLADIGGDGQDLVLGFGKNALEGAALHGIGRIAQGARRDLTAVGPAELKRELAFKSESSMRTALSTELPIKQELALNLKTGALYGAVKAGSDQTSWRDSKGHFSIEHGINNLTDWQKLSTSAATGALLSTPASMLAGRIANASISLTSARVGDSLARIGGGTLSGAASGAVFGGLDATVHGKSVKEIGHSALEGMLIGASTGGVISTGTTLSQRLLSSGRAQTGSSHSETAPALTSRTEKSNPVANSENTRPRESSAAMETLAWKVEPKPTTAELAGQLRETDRIGQRLIRLSDSPKRPDSFTSLTEFAKWLRLKNEPAIVYQAEGLKTKIIVPEAYAAKLDTIRRLRLEAEVELPLFDKLERSARRKLEQAVYHGNFEPIKGRFAADADNIIKVVTARQKLSNDPANMRALPEDFLQPLKELPNPGLIKKLVLLDEPNYFDAYLYQGNAGVNGGRFGNSAANASRNGTIRFFRANNDLQPGSTATGTIREGLFHEWSHLVKYRFRTHSTLFNASADLEPHYFASDYARDDFFNIPGAGHHENFAVHFGERLLMPDKEGFLTTTREAPLRTVTMARSWLAAMRPDFQHKTIGAADLPMAISRIPLQIANQEATRARLEYIVEQVEPLARLRLQDHLRAGNALERLHASFLLNRMGNLFTNSPLVYRLRRHWLLRQASLNSPE